MTLTQRAVMAALFAALLAALAAIVYAAVMSLPGHRHAPAVPDPPPVRVINA